MPTAPLARPCGQPCTGDAGGHGPTRLAGPPGHTQPEPGPRSRGQQRAAGTKGRTREERRSAAAGARVSSHAGLSLAPPPRSPRHPCCPLPRSPPALPRSRRARGQGIGLVTSSTASLSTERTPPRPANPSHRPQPRAPIDPTLSLPGLARPDRRDLVSLPPSCQPYPLRRGKSGPVRHGPREGLRPGWVRCGRPCSRRSIARPRAAPAGFQAPSGLGGGPGHRAGRGAAGFCFGKASALLVRSLPGTCDCVSPGDLRHQEKVAEVAPVAE